MASRFTIHDGIVFSESNLEGIPKGEITEKAAGQNTTLAEVKTKMAIKVKLMGGDAIMNFSYSQKADRGRNIFKWDTERIVCHGTVLSLTNPGDFQN